MKNIVSKLLYEYGMKNIFSKLLYGMKIIVSKLLYGMKNIVSKLLYGMKNIQTGWWFDKPNSIFEK
jgi:hypothetical protein